MAGSAYHHVPTSGSPTQNLHTTVTKIIKILFLLLISVCVFKPDPLNMFIHCFTVDRGESGNEPGTTAVINL